MNRHRGRRNFWWAWEQERQRLHGQDADNPQSPERPSPPEMMNAWRNFFHGFTGEWPEHHWAFGGRRFTPWHRGDVSFNPFVANLFSQGGGLLPLIVLHLLAEKPRYGNEIMSLLSEKTSGQWVANPGAIYPLMTELENRGLVAGVWEDPRKRTVRIYHLTEFGEREFKRVTTIIRPKLTEAIEVLQTLVNDLDDNPKTVYEEGEIE